MFYSISCQLSPYIQGPWEMDLVFFLSWQEEKLSVVSCVSIETTFQIRVSEEEEEETSGSLFYSGGTSVKI